MGDPETEPGLRWRNLLPGDRAPHFAARAPGNDRFHFDSTAGRWLVLAFAGTLADEATRAAIEIAAAATDVFDDRHASLFTISVDPADEAERRLSQQLPGRRIFWDFDGAVSRLYGALPEDRQTGHGGRVALRRFWLVIDPGLVIRRIVPFTADGTDTAEVLAFLRGAPSPGRHMGFAVPAPVLILPEVFEPEFCDRLVGLYAAHGGEASGFMREIDGRTVAVEDKGFKSRRDYLIEDKALISEVQARILRRVIPEIERVHYFRCTRMERYIVSCYAADEGGHFSPHRDNTTRGTAHRRFAVSINLNDGFSGGAVSFPEYSPEGYKAPKGGAVVFSCRLLHAVSRVTAGQRFAFLPFLYDDAAARIREANAGFVDTGAAAYRA